MDVKTCRKCYYIANTLKNHMIVFVLIYFHVTSFNALNDTLVALLDLFIYLFFCRNFSCRMFFTALIHVFVDSSFCFG